MLDAKKNINYEEYLEDLKRVDLLMQRGPLLEETTKKKYYTGYEYKTLYDWDQYFEAIVQLHMGWDTSLVRNAVTIFLDHQNDDGFIARTVPVGSLDAEGREMVKPFLAQIAYLVYKRDRDLSWLDDAYYNKLKKYLIHWLVDMDKNGNHLSTWASGPHTGMDNQHERAGYWNDYISEGIDLNCFLVRECEAFCEIAKLKGKKEDQIEISKNKDDVVDAIQKYLWNEEDGFFYDLNEKTNEQLKYKSSAAFSTLWAGVATKEQAEILVKDHLMNEEEFLRPFPFPSYAANEPGYSEEYLPGDMGCSWRANTWIPVNYYIFHGLKKYGYDEIAEDLAYKTYEMVKKIGDREYYTSESCTGCGLDPFWGWSLLAYFMPLENELNLNPTNLKLSFTDAFKITSIK